MVDNMVSMADYQNFGEGEGIGSPADVENLRKALDTGGYAQVNGIDSQVNGAAMQVESLEASLKALTWTNDHIKFWKKIDKTPAYATVEEYNQILSYGEPDGGFILDGELPQTTDSEYRRQAALVKFLGTTREVTHGMTLVRSAHGDIIARENQNGILWMMERIENGLFWGNSKLAANGQEGAQFDGLDTLIPDENTLDLKGGYLTEQAVNDAAAVIIDNYGTPTDLFLSFETWKTFNNTYFPKERIIMPTQQGYQAGVVVNQFQTIGGSVSFNPDLFLGKTKELKPNGYGGFKAPVAPASVTVAVGTETDAEFEKSGAGTYSYSVTAANRFGESVPTEAAADVTMTEADFVKGVAITITNAAAATSPTEWYNIYRTEADGKEKYRILQVPATTITAGATVSAVDTNVTMPNTYTSFIGELSPQVLTFRQLAPIMKMDLARLGPVYRWMILLYGTPILFAPKKWVKIKNIKSDIKSIGHH